MRMRMTTGWGVAIAAAAAFAACSLHLDKSKIGAHDAGADSSSGGSAGSAGSPAGGSSGKGSGGKGSGGNGGAATGGKGGTGGTVAEAGTECDASSQCKTDAGCLQGTCENGNCSYQLCPVTQACTSSTCNTTTQTCSKPTKYTFRAGTINVDQALASSAANSVAAMGDYVFVATSSEIEAWRVTDPGAPVSVQVSPQPPFATSIVRLVSNDKRVLILGPKTSGNTFNVAWIDLPTDPTTTQIKTNSAHLQFADYYNSVYPADGDNFYLVKDDAANFFPSARLEPPLTNNATINLSGCAGLVGTDWTYGASGTRLIQYHVDASSGTPAPVFGFENNAGTSGSQYGGDQNLSADTGEVPGSRSAGRFESTYNGGLLWATNNVLPLPDGGTAKMSDSVMFYWLLLSGNDTTFNAKRSVAIEQYSPQYPENNVYAGRMAEIDSTTALVTAGFSGDPTGQTAVRVVKRSGDTLSVLPALSSEGNLITFPPGNIGVVAGRRFGFILAPPSNTVTPDTKIYIFDPNCTQ